ncbi:type III polyketide synthase [Amnibacterium flavum]|uniref:Type III polyketide synthase n=1 Tax=Amnibacterium flavum TaxID=2173173 RepID=A0A2V1HNG0_9MICO|nr:3-oxoacyl-[acyl-carrier-protein] synthase III C-terminal domain-containing protein [Amnibacterium flavum]PVZ93941.1 type III polyketide synthase [Amnibacterium flavum]
MSRIAAVATALPPYRYPQAEITEMLAPMITSDPAKQAVMRRLHEGSKVATRHLVMPLERYREALTFTQSNDSFVEHATDLAETATRRALERAGITADEVDLVIFTSVTGVSAPSIDALLVPRLGLRPDVKRVPMFGLGCVGGAAGLGRLHDYLLGHPDDVAVLVSVELCSLTVQRDDDSMANLVASGLFGDGAAAVIAVGARRAERLTTMGPDIIDARSHLYPDSGHVLGFTPGSTGFRIVLTGGISDAVDEHFSHDVVEFLGDNGLDLAGVSEYFAHPGGPRVLEAFARALDVADSALDASWKSMAAVGNLSSSSVLHVLADSLDTGDRRSGDSGLLFALGPGLSAELILLRWPETAAAA